MQRLGIGRVEGGVIVVDRESKLDDEQHFFQAAM